MVFIVLSTKCTLANFGKNGDCSDHNYSWVGMKCHCTKSTCSTKSLGLSNRHIVKKNL